MQFATINPASGELLRSYPFLSADRVDAALIAGPGRPTRMEPGRGVRNGQGPWPKWPGCLRVRHRRLAETVTMEMGKHIGEALFEVEKCASGCEYYSRNGAGFLRDQVVETESYKSYVTFQPLGLVLAIMPWNFPLWQVMRAAVPALIAGNGVLLKHAPSVPCCALELTDLFAAAGLPDGLFTNLFVDVDTTGELIRDARVQGVTLTGSTRAGRQVAGIAGSQIKTCVLELGGSDPYVVLEDADLPRTVEACVTGRLLNAGQSCIAAKRMIVHEAVADDFTAGGGRADGRRTRRRADGRDDRRRAARTGGSARPSGRAGRTEHRGRRGVPAGREGPRRARMVLPGHGPDGRDTGHARLRRRRCSDRWRASSGPGRKRRP